MMELRNRSLFSTSKQSGWSYEIIEFLFIAGRSQDQSTDQWFIVPNHHSLKKNNKVEKYCSYFISSLLNKEDDRNDFILDLFQKKKAKQSIFNFLKEEFAKYANETNIKELEGYVFLNFCPTLKRPAQQGFLLKSFLQPRPPDWAVVAANQYLQKPIVAANQYLQKPIVAANQYLQKPMITTENKDTSIAEEIDIQISHFGDGVQLNPNPFVFHNNVDIIKNVAIIDDFDETEFLASFKRRLKNDPDEPIQYNIIDLVDTNVLLTSLLKRLSDDPCILNHIKSCIKSSISMQSAIIDSDDENIFLSSLKTRIKEKGDLLKNMEDAVIIKELIRRSKIQVDKKFESSLERNRIHFLQKPEDMTEKRRYEMGKAIETLTAVCISVLMPNQTNEEIREYDTMKKQTRHYEYCKRTLISMKDIKPQMRRPQLAYFTSEFTKNEVEELMDSHISWYEWSQARKHAKFPGAGKPIIKVIHRRCRVSNEAILSFDDALTEDNLQRLAFGTKSARFPEGHMERFASVRTTKKPSTLWNDYSKIQENLKKALVPFSTVLEDEEEECGRHESCPSENKKGLKCCKQSGHSGRCQYTTKSGISESTFRRLINLCTSGHNTSLAGLDNEEVEKGRENFNCLKVMVLRLSELTGTPSESITNLIDDIEDFHQCDFISHIKASTDGNEILSQCKCCCLKCGFNTPLDEIACERKILHQGVCSMCARSFSIFPLISKMIAVLKQQNEIPQLPSMNDEISHHEYHLNRCRQNLMDYRAHLVLKHDEKEADKEELLNLKSHQAIIVSDWKMKILQAFHRETQQDFFGKRGTSMIGFMIISHQPTEIASQSHKDVNFHFMLTDDTVQDNVSVNAAKCLLYQRCLPAHVTEVRFRADGAGCFSSNMTKASMGYWHTWTGIREISNRQSPAGGGKTNLDGQFGVFQRHLWDRVDEGRNISDSASIYDLMEETSRLKATSFYIFSPNRDSILRCNLKGLNQYYSISLSEESDDLILRKHSRHSQGKIISKKELEESILICQGDESIEEKLEEGEDPPAPTYNLYRATQQYDRNTLKDTGVSYLEKKENDLKDRVSKCNKNLENINCELTDRQIRAGLFPCEARNEQGKKCKSVFMSKARLEKHEKTGQHKFPKINTKTKVFMHAVDESGVLSSSKFSHNRSLAVQREDFGLQLVLENTIDERDWFQDGCYNKPKRKPAIRMSNALKSDLLEMFEEGVRTNSKYTAVEALNKLKDMKNPDGRCKYSHHPDNINGPLPDEGRIKSFFSSEKMKRTRPSKEKDCGYASMKIERLKEELEKRNLPNKPNTQFFLQGLLRLHDQALFIEKNVGEDEDYQNWKVMSLKEEIVRRELDISTPKNQLLTMLNLSDLLVENVATSD